VADDAAVCPKCDTVLDASLFSNAPPVRDDDPEDAAPPPPKNPAKRPVTSGTGKPVGGRKPSPNVASAPKAGPGGQPGKRRMPDAPVREVREKRDTDWRSKIDPNEWKENAPPPPPPQGPAYQAVDPEDLMGSVKSFMIDLTTADKIAFFGTLAAILACFFPWKDSITEGEVLGLMSLGAAVFLMCVVILGSIVIRVRGSFPNLNNLVPWLIQFGGACFCIVWCLVYVKISWDSTMARSPIGNFERWVSRPEAGVFIALITSVVTLGGTVLGLKEKSR
jgi:hypothetical protein